MQQGNDPLNGWPAFTTMRACYQCARCTSGCPVATLDPEYNPRRIFRLAVLGEKEAVLKDEKLWYCLACYTCQERCPEEARPAEVLLALKNLACERGFAPAALLAAARLVAEDGRLYNIDEFHNEYREEEGLPALDEETGILGKLLALTGLQGRLVE
ncbi:4Fe-4S dicluster domain-containing protein [Neomoorella thermoacetica]|uniref:Anaerobic glycerol-3-phosphate dehydrogenase subunit C n=2 Tax=Neomoorella thermoacetica TaxID=1525 RepID=A0AAC9HFV7_NEOTH|nr:4Fe-4S dicluster domain-containing protein [Moorella thermoacetica]AKX93188.1 anaerobic glycerol-3-phosphate dehydrogenase subunit C [Moorella thermoacetica]AKX95830.1 anaerobic glycerol-3-phosphate dehydrogenase subunit C [Moorella thermoacetica]AOQ22852.1 Anaerobic glycerol-3-phosphate dehydrogenase subunit C [Moorella thermoacetica]OIQ53843.1 anaerobic glycerol-3-phosphate dehydrogenase subunit C [Moorella thermoacetica]OIQ55917.1 anaerobic glycerol-3-phosphate dehydrogenase subunit C [M